MKNFYACTTNNKQFILSGMQITKIAQNVDKNQEIDLSQINTSNALDVFKNNITCGDAISLTSLLPDNCLDAVITDPPYASGGILTIDKSKSTGEKYLNYADRAPFADFSGDMLGQISYKKLITDFLALSFSKLKNGGIVALFTDWRQYGLIYDCFLASDLTPRGCIVWDKTNARNILGRPKNQCEYILYASKGHLSTKRNVARNLKGLISGIVNAKDRYHQTGKPTKVMEELLAICEPNSLILDPFAGSGTTCVACRNLGHDFIGFEKVSAIAKNATLRLQGKAKSLQDFINQRQKQGYYKQFKPRASREKAN